MGMEVRKFKCAFPFLLTLVKSMYISNYSDMPLPFVTTKFLHSEFVYIKLHLGLMEMQ